ncbi:MAG TPA: hypothetical protein VLK82_19960 [Candidatus Tectomicrobia bacterium]|nr:hypothetical protein [Candidatus Tectomicrobia bacterium]
MRQLSFVLQFQGSASPVAGSSQTLQAQTTAANQTFRTVLGADGIQATLEAPGGGHAAFASRVVVNADGTFDETGTITYGNLGAVEFRTLGRGYMFPSGIEGLQRGGVLWEVTGGTGRFTGATGVITSNFSVGSDGKVVDNHFAVLYLPE